MQWQKRIVCIPSLTSDCIFVSLWIRVRLTYRTPSVLELRKIQEHVNLINRDNKSSLSRRSTYPPSGSIYVDEKSSHRGRARSLDRRHSSRAPPPVYTVEEYEEEKRRPSHIDTRKAQSDHWHSHALPTSSSKEQRQLEYTPETDSFDDSPKDRHGRHRRHHRREDRDREGSHRGSLRSHSNSTVDRGRTRSRSVHTELRVTETTDDADSEGEEYYSRRRRRDEYQRDGGHGRRDGRGR